MSWMKGAIRIALHSREEWAHSAFDFASPVEKSAIMVQKGSPPYEEPKNEKEIIKSYFKCKVQFTDVTPELVI